MFDALSKKLETVFSHLRGKGKLSEQEVTDGLREIRLALLEADVNYKVAKELVSSVQERATGAEVLESLTPGQQIVKIVRDELTRLMGQQQAQLSLDSHPAVIMLVGLQGSGKTTTAGKLATQLSKQGKNPLLVAADTYRPAAQEQLETLADQLNLPSFGDGSSPEDVVRSSISWAKQNLCDVVIIDTAGRLQIDEKMMNEVERIKTLAHPDEILFVADAMTGQEAVNITDTFHQRIDLTGIVLTKLDGDARGGAALSIHYVTGCPIKFVGIGEKLDQLEPFHPDRMANRILGMGDVLSLIEQAETTLDKDKATDLARKISKNRFTLQDFLDQLVEMRKMGPLAQVLEKLPGGNKLTGSAGIDEQEIDRALAILRSMNLEERLKPSIIGGSRKKRIARGSGTKVRDVNRVLSRFRDAKKAMKLIGGKRGKGKLPFNLPGM